MNSKLIMLTTIIVISGCVWFGGVTNAQAGSKLLLVPISGDNAKPLNNIVTVAKANGDYTDPIQALASITDASEGNRYVLIIGPGDYLLSQPLVMKSNVNIVGSGKALTRLVGSFSGGNDDTEAVVVLADDSRLQGLAIQNNGGSGAICIGIASGAFGQHISTEVSDVDIAVQGCNSTRGINSIFSKLKINRVSITASGQITSTGLTSINSEVFISELQIYASGTNINRGITNTTGSLIIADSNIRAFGGLNHNGLSNNNNLSSAKIFNSVISASSSGESENVALTASNGVGEHQTYVVNSSLEGVVTGDPKCSFVFLANGNPLDSACAP